jgi:pyruvate/2-oxoglutarate dehydrogenase complex dihydrolipoamide acyltransferase (E2) component
MRVEVRLPQLSMGMSDAEIVQWYVAVGDHVEAEQDIVEIEAEKATVTVPAPSPGTIASIDAAPGAVIEVRDLLCVIEGDG